MTTNQDESRGSRRRFLKGVGAATAGAVVLGNSIPAVHAGEDNTIRLSLIGCGGRGSGAVGNALNTADQGPIKLYAAADVDEPRMEASLQALKRRYSEGVDVPKDRMFVGFDAYKKAIDILRPGDVALCTTRCYIRPVHVEYAVKRGINVFMEKPFAPDPAGLKRMLKAGELAEKTGSKIAAGLQCRHSPARAALIDKLRNGEFGELSYVRANRLTGRRWLQDMGDKANDIMEQFKFGKAQLLWLGSGHMVDNLIHQIDECCWIMDDWPVSCHGMGAREVGSMDRSQNNDTYSMEFTYPNGKKAFCGFRRALNGYSEFATWVHGSKRAGQFSGSIHKATVHMFEDQRIADDKIVWSPTPDEFNPWDYEWMAFIDSIRNDKPHNEAKRAVYADYASLMGRAACHLNRIVTWDEVTNSEFAFCDYLDDIGYDGPSPAVADENGFFPAPEAGKWTEL